MPKNEKNDQRRSKRAKHLRLLSSILAFTSIGSLLASLLVISSSALGTGYVEFPEGRRLYPLLNNITLYETYADRSDPDIIYYYYNDFDQPLFDEPDQNGWETSIQYSADGDREANRPITIYHQARRETATYERFNANPIPAIGTLPIHLFDSGLPLAEFSSNDILYEDTVRDEGSIVFRYMFGSSSAYTFSQNGVADELLLRVSYDELSSGSSAEWTSYTYDIRRPIVSYTTVTGSSTYVVEFDVLDFLPSSWTYRNITVQFLADIQSGGDTLTSAEVETYGIHNTGVGATMYYLDSPKSYGVNVLRPTYVDNTFNPLEWISNVVDSILSIQLFETLGTGVPFTLGSVFAVTVTVMFVVVILKFFYGG